ncbi:MAG: ATP-dependent Clp protease ATP-binding subunit [Oscillospiraceae bacterium]|nr:ATP-dependent Clp protease ATP-binding subunit [Oscillospiraceae bacterium]
MKPVICSRCKKNVAVVFITKIENGNPTNEGLCLKCAKELGIKPVQDMMQNMGISDEELDGISNEMLAAFGGAENLDDVEDGGEDENGKTATFPFLNKLFSNPHQSDEQHPPERDQQKEPDRASTRGNKRKFLENYCISLTKKAKEGALDRIVGREEETERVIQILNRRQKNNPCLIGEPGVGKTAIAEGLAQRIERGEVPYKLRDKEVWLLDLTALVAGTQFRGQFESRMKGMIDEVKKQGNIILVIDEVHTIVGAGDAEGSMNAANILKPALSRGEIQVIGATTFAEYRKHIEKDSALERRFQPVIVNEPSISDSIEIIKGIKRYYEDYHGVTISDEMARQAVVLSERYITDRYLPDKAIDLIDEACSDVNLRNDSLARLADIQKELDDLAKERELLLSGTDEDANYERLAELRSQELRLSREKESITNEKRPELTLNNLAHIIEMWTKIPASSIREDEYEHLSKLDERLKQHIIGQDEAVDAVCAAIKRNRVGISAKRKPVSFIFVGSTGVGKTELVKRLAADLFDSPESLIRLDMSEFMEKHAVSRIIGSPPGYVGYDEAGQLTEKIRRKPYSVVLFDEIEKAHPDVMNILLQILDDGHITDAHGRTVNFENTVIIMTTNAGSDSKTGSVGFNQSLSEQGREKAMKALNDFLRPEFINRVDEIVCFNRLSEDNFRGIARIMLGELVDAMKEKGLVLTYTDAVVDYLVEKSYSVTYGARNLRRLIQKEIEDPVANVIIENYTAANKSIAVDCADGAITVACIVMMPDKAQITT